MKKCFYTPLLLFILAACSEQSKEKSLDNSKNSVDANQKILVTKTAMNNPVLMSGTNIGKLFNAYYRTGQVEQLITFTDKHTIEKIGREKLGVFYKNLNYGYNMELSGQRQEGVYKLLTYTCIINATKVIKQLRVVIENDTARIVPFNPQLGEIFE